MLAAGSPNTRVEILNGVSWHWNLKQAMGESGEVWAPRIAAAGVLVISVATALYSYAEGFMSFVTPSLATVFARLAYAYLGVMLMGGALVSLGVRRFFARRIGLISSKGFTPLSPGWILPYVLSQNRFRRYFVASTLLYGLFYAFITSVIVYQPTVDFVQAYRAVFPSMLIGPCCGPPLYTPVLTVYIVNHLGLLVIPLTVILLVTVSVLVGLNFALAAFAFSNRMKNSGRSWVGGLGALVGLFTGCPTCAGLFFANVIGGTGAVSFATLLGYYQPVFIALSIPVLVATPYLISRSLSRVIKGGCVVALGDKRPPTLP